MSLESIDNNISEQITILLRMATLANDAQLIMQLQSIKELYMKNSCLILIEYTEMQNTNDLVHNTFIERMDDFLTSSCILNTLEELSNKLLKIKIGGVKILSSAKSKKEIEYEELVKSYKKIPIYEPTARNTGLSQVCKNCKINMVLYQERAEYECQLCGNTIPEYGTGEPEVKHKERNKRGNYEQFENGCEWLDLIQGNIYVEIPKNVIQDVKKDLLSLGITDKRKVSYKQLRRSLKRTGHTAYYGYETILRYEITKLLPSQLTADERSLALGYLSKVIQYYNIIKGEGQSNLSYAPYFLLKILEQILPEGNVKEKRRKWDILSAIHMQQKKTTDKNDKKYWINMLPYFPEFKYENTEDKYTYLY